MAAGSRMRERRTSGSERGRGINRQVETTTRDPALLTLTVRAGRMDAARR